MDHTPSTDQIDGNERFRLRGRVRPSFLDRLSSLIDQVLRIRFVSVNETDEIMKNFYSDLSESLAFVEEHPEGMLSPMTSTPRLMITPRMTSTPRMTPINNI